MTPPPPPPPRVKARQKVPARPARLTGGIWDGESEGLAEEYSREVVGTWLARPPAQKALVAAARRAEEAVNLLRGRGGYEDGEGGRGSPAECSGMRGGGGGRTGRNGPGARRLPLAGPGSGRQWLAAQFQVSDSR